MPEFNRDRQVTKPSVLVIYPGPVPPEREREKNVCFWLSDCARGWFVQPVWWSADELCRRLEISAADEFTVRDFEYRFIHPFEANGLIRRVLGFYKLVAACRSVLRGEKPDLIYTYGSNSTGLAGVVLKLLTGAKLVVMIPGVPSKAFVLEERDTGVVAKIKKLLADVLLYICMSLADGVKLLYPTQLSGYRVPTRLKKFVFHDFTPVSKVNVRLANDKRLLILGYPWHRKGIDVAIRAFRQIEREFPEYSLEVCGHCLPADRPYYESLTGDSDRILLGKGVYYDEAIAKLAQCAVMVLPSRTEAMGRVNLEAFYLRKPIVAAAVDGIPFYVRDGETGLLFRPEDSNDLAAKLRLILTDPKLRERLTENGYRAFSERYSERAFAEEFRLMLGNLLQ